MQICRFENIGICSGSFRNTTLKISHSLSLECSSYLPVKFVFYLKSKKHIQLFLYVCKQTFHVSWVRVSQKVKGGIM